MKVILINYVLLLLCYGIYTDYIKFEEFKYISLVYSETDIEQNNLNDKFIEMAIKIGFHCDHFQKGYHDPDPEPGETDIHEIIKAEDHDISGNPFVISFGASGYCDAINEVQKSSFLCIRDFEECPSNKTVIIFSEGLLQYKRLYNAIVTKNFEVSDNVIVCLPHNLPDIEDVKDQLKKFSKLPLEFPDSCESGVDLDPSVLAIVTPSPFLFETTLPTIIYNSPYTDDIVDLPNAINLMTNSKPLKYAILKFMNSMHWHRVAVISDDDEDSEEFLNELIPVFEQGRIIYTSQTCNKWYCDFYEAAAYLMNADARIGILNMNYRNVEKLMPYLNHNASRSVTWIVRDWPFRKDEKENHDLFSFTLSPAFGDEKSYTPYLSGIKEGLKIINKQYLKAYGDRELFLEYFALEIKYPRSYQTLVHIVRKYSPDFQVVSTMIPTGREVISEIHRSKIYANIPPDTYPSCMIKSKNYKKPCNDEELVLYLSVLVMFILVFLMILIYFSRIRSNTYRRLF